MKYCYAVWWSFLLTWLGTSFPAKGQSPQTPAIRYALNQARADTTRVLLLAELSGSFRYSRFDSVRWYAERGLALARQIHYPKGEGRCLTRLALDMGERGNLAEALRLNLQALQLNEASNDQAAIARTFNQVGLLYQALDDYRLALQYYFRAWRIYQKIRSHDTSQLVSVLANIGATYTGAGKLDSASHYLQRAEKLIHAETPGRWSSWGNPEPYVLREQGLLAATQGQQAAALRYYRQSARSAVPENDQRSACRAYLYIAELYHAQQRIDSSMFYARKALLRGQQIPYTIGVLRASHLLSDGFFKRRQLDSALHFLQIKQTAEDSLYDPRRVKKMDAVGFAEVQRLRQLEREQAAYKRKLYTYAMVASLLALLLITLLQARHSRQQHRVNAQLRELNEQVTAQKESLVAQHQELSQTLLELKAAQNRLSQRDQQSALVEQATRVVQEINHPTQEIQQLADQSQQLLYRLQQQPAAAELTELLGQLTAYQAQIAQHSQQISTSQQQLTTVAG